MSVKRHEELMEAFYRRPQVPPVAPALQERFRLESERRILDLCRILWKRWPLAALYGRALYGDAMSFGTAAHFPEVRRRARNVDSAVALAFGQWIDSVGDSMLAGLKQYDEARSGRGGGARAATRREKLLLLRAGLGACRLLEFDFNVLSLARTLEHYGNLHAPDAFICGLLPGSERQVLAFSSREGQVFAADVTSLLVRGA